MSGLLKEIEDIDGPAADKLREAGLQSDSDIQALTEGGLHELLPGKENDKSRRAISDIIHKQTIDRNPKELKGFIPEASMRAALTDDGVLLRDMKTRMDEVLTFIEAHINFLNEYKTNPSDQESDSNQVDKMDTSGETDEAGLQSDSDIQALTEGDLHKLLSGPPNIKRRRNISDIIHKQPIDRILKELKPFIPEASMRAALTDDGVLVDYLGHLMDMKTQMIKNRTAIEAHIDSLKEYKTNPSDQESASNQVDKMDTSSGETDAASKDQTRRSLPEDRTNPQREPGSPGGAGSGSHVGPPPSGGPKDLLSSQSESIAPAAAGSSPHSGSFDSGDEKGSQSTDQPPKQRRTVSTEETNNQSEPRPHAAADALTDDGVLVDYLGHPRDMETQMIKNRTAIEAEIDSLKEYKTNPSDQESASSQVDKMDTSSGETDAASKDQRQRSLHEDRTNPQRETRRYGGTVTLYRMVVSGQTFTTHLKLMEKIKKQVQNLLYEDKTDNHSVTFVFCPISSRVASDVEAAMSDVTDGKPVILVLMHHTHQVRVTSTMRTWNVGANILLHVNVFYHESCGLLQCDENNAAVTEIRNKLLESFIQKSLHTSGNALSGGVEVVEMVTDVKN